MFTGIVEQSVCVSHVEELNGVRQIVLHVGWPDLKLGDSIAVNGACLTVASFNDASCTFQAVKETLDKTNLGLIGAGDLVHVERSLRVGDRIDGHMVQGHIDGIATLVRVTNHPSDWRLTARVPRDFVKYLVPKGSVCLDGVSLTIASLDDNLIEIAVIPTTLQITQLGNRPIGWPLNFEADATAKTIVAFLERRQSAVV